MVKRGETSLFEVDWNFHFCTCFIFWLESFYLGFSSGICGRKTDKKPKYSRSDLMDLDP